MTKRKVVLIQSIALVLVLSSITIFSLYLGITTTVKMFNDAVNFFRAPDAIHQITDTFIPMGICFGIALILLACLIIAININAIREEKAFKTIRSDSRDYPVRCFAIRGDFPGLPERETKTPIYFNVTLTNHGVCLTGDPKGNDGEILPTEVEIPFGLFNRDWSNPVIIPLCYSRMDPIDDDQPEISISFSQFIQKSNLRKVEQLNKTLHLNMVVLNENGDNDAIATNELYKKIYDRIQQEMPGGEEAWMYESRPIVW